MLLVKYIVLSIFPIWKILLIWRKSNDRFFFIIYFFNFFVSRSNLEIFEILVFCSFHIHLVRVDNFTFFFQIECFSILNNNRIFEFLLIVFLIPTQQSFRIGISYKFISTSGFSSTTIASNGVIYMWLILLASWTWSDIFSVLSIYDLFLFRINLKRGSVKKINYWWLNYLRIWSCSIVSG